MTKNVFVLDGHPVEGSFSSSICAAYAEGAAQSGHKVRVLKISEMKFDLDLDHGYGQEKTLEPSLVAFQENLTWCDHFVLGHPLWWGTVPAKTKGLIDRTFLPGFAFSFDVETKKITKLMAGKSAHVIVTSDTPNWYFNLVYHRASFHMMKTQVLGFCGFGPIKFKHYSTVMDANEAKRHAWLEAARSDGARLAT